MKTELLEKEGIQIIYLKGDLDLFNSLEIKKYILKKIDEESLSELVINLKEITYLDSSGIGILISIFVKNKETRHIRICELNENMYKTLKVAGLTEFLNIDTTEEESIKKIIQEYKANS